MKDIKPTNEYKKVILENIVFLQGQDYVQYEIENPDSDIDYLMQWYYAGEHETSEHLARDINTPFLGRLIKIDGYKGYFLFSKSYNMGYMGLSRIVSIG